MLRHLTIALKLSFHKSSDTYSYLHPLWKFYVCYSNRTWLNLVFSSRYTFTSFMVLFLPFLLLVLAHKRPISKKVAFMTAGVKRKYNASCTMISVCVLPFFLSNFSCIFFIHCIYALKR